MHCEVNYGIYLALYLTYLENHGIAPRFGAVIIIALIQGFV